MFEYNRWANAQLLEACRGLNPALLNSRPLGLSGTIGELLVHIVGGQQTFVLRTEGRQNEEELNRDSLWPGIDSLIDIAATTSDELIAIADGLDDEREVDLPYMGNRFRFPKRFFLVHALEHGVEHRTEVKLGLAQLGVETPDLDGWAYSTAMGYGREV